MNPKAEKIIRSLKEKREAELLEFTQKEIRQAVKEMKDRKESKFWLKKIEEMRKRQPNFKGQSVEVRE